MGHMHVYTHLFVPVLAIAGTQHLLHISNEAKPSSGLGEQDCGDGELHMEQLDRQELLPIQKLAVLMSSMGYTYTKAYNPCYSLEQPAFVL